MSQFQPPPFQPPPPRYSHAEMYGVPAERRTNGFAIASIVCGIIGCFLITSFAAIILGIVGIIKGNDPRYSGKGLAIAGIILGALWLGFWGLFGGSVWGLYRSGAPARSAAQALITDLSNNNLPAARARVGPAMSQADLQQEAAILSSEGQLQDISAPFVHDLTLNGKSETTVIGSITLAHGRHSFVARMQKQGTQYVITDFTLDNSKRRASSRPALPGFPRSPNSGSTAPPPALAPPAEE